MFSLSISQPKWDNAKNKVPNQLLQLQLQYRLQRKLDRNLAMRVICMKLPGK